MEADGKSWQAYGIGCDRRIPAKGIDTETYYIPLPARGEYQAAARLMYRSMTQESLDQIFRRNVELLPPVASVEMSATKTTAGF